MRWPLNELVKLTMFWTTGPRLPKWLILRKSETHYLDGSVRFFLFLFYFIFAWSSKHSYMQI